MESYWTDLLERRYGISLSRAQKDKVLTSLLNEPTQLGFGRKSWRFETYRL